MRRLGGHVIEWYEFGVHGYFATTVTARFLTPEGGSEVEGLYGSLQSFTVALGRLGGAGAPLPATVLSPVEPESWGRRLPSPLTLRTVVRCGRGRARS